MHQHEPQDEIVAVGLERCDADLDGAFERAVHGHEHGALAHGDAPAGRERLAHRIAERAAVALIHQRGYVGEGLAEDLLGGLTEKRRGRVVDVVDASLRIDGDHALAHRIEGDHRARP